MISRPLAARCAILLALALTVSGCGQKNIFPNPFKSRGTKGYQGTGTRIPVLDSNRSLEPSEALKGVGFAVPPVQPVPAWPLPSGPPDMTVDHSAAAPAFEIAWKRDVGAGGSRKTHPLAAPVLEAGKLYVMDGEARVSALDAKTGREIWSTNMAVRSRRDREAYGGGVAYSAGVLYVTSGYRFMAALDAATGKVKWRTVMQSPVHGAPTVGGGKVFAVDVEDQMFALDQETGIVAWNYQGLEEPARLRAASAPVVQGDVVVAPFASGEIVAFRTSNGSVLWMDTLSFTNRNNALSEIRDIAGRPVIYRDEVFAGSHSGLFGALALRDGQRRWELPITSVTTPWPAGDVIYAVDTQGKVICIARESGQIYWAVELNAGIKKAKKRPAWSSPVLASNRLVLVNSDGQAVALDPKTGKKTGELKLGSAAFVTPTPADGMLYVMTDSGVVVAIR